LSSMRNVTAAIEFGTSKIICIIGRTKSVGRFEVLGTGVAKYEGIKNGRWQTPANVENAVAKALDLAERKARKHVKEAYIGVPGVFSKVVCQDGHATVKGGRVTSKDIESLIDDAGRFYNDPRFTVVAGMPIYFLIGDQNHYIDVIGSEADELSGKVSFILVRNQYLEVISKIMQGLSVAVKAYIPEVLAESLFLVPPEERDASAVLLNIGYYDTNVTVVYGDAIVYNKTIHAGGMHIANDLSIVMNIDVDMAEQLKKQYSFGLENAGAKLYDYAKLKTGRVERFCHSIVSDVIDARVEHLCKLISGAFQESPLKIARRTRIFLSGGGLSIMKGARDILENQLKRQVRLSRIDAPQLSTPNYYVALALLDYVFESDYFDEGYGGKSIFKRLSDKMYE
jgi:cell division protein FtsA